MEEAPNFEWCDFDVDDDVCENHDHTVVRVTFPWKKQKEYKNKAWRQNQPMADSKTKDIMALWQVRLSISLRHRFRCGRGRRAGPGRMWALCVFLFFFCETSREADSVDRRCAKKLRERDVGWCKSPGLERRAGPAKQLFGMRAVMPVLHQSWHPGQRNYDERWLYHDCNCKCKSCSAATLFLCITMSCPNKKFTFHFISRRDGITLTNNNHWQMNNIKGDD